MKCYETITRYEKAKKCVEYVWHILRSTLFAFHISHHFARGDSFLMKHQKFIIENKNFIKMIKSVQKNVYTFHILFHETR